jgi:PIN domain nuclease of toxin-antitoxin system
VKALLDTNVFLWCIGGRKSRLSKTAARVIEDEKSELQLSAVSLWEIAVKAQAGKLEIPMDKSYYVEHMGFLGIQTVLPVEARHIYQLLNLPPHHRDPFDRLLVAQCIAEKLPFVASDVALHRYPVQIIW